ncbi:putative secreted protein [Hydromonas duriensis]|uniref:Putative secreted protein n=2 Tax=Hydromonas duriensis TaxID=1527608 RepID=A0A4R6YA55_9BURK|nr:putative secreted protein [Hydromonas duriensis]
MVGAVQAPLAFAQNVNVNQNGTLVEMCAMAQQEVEQDRANVQVSYKFENRDKRIAADEVNKTMTAVIQRIKTSFPEVKIDNQNYNTYQQHTSKGQAKEWTVEQTFTLESKNPKEVPSLVSMLQEAGITINGMNSFVAPETAQRMQEKLYNEAFKDVQLRLSAISSGMGRSNAWQIVHIDTTGQRGCGAGRPMPMMAVYRKAMMDESPLAVAAPSFEAGKEAVQLSLWVAAKMK